MIELEKVLTTEEFLDAIESGLMPVSTEDSWLLAVSAIVSTFALAHESYSKEDMVMTIQRLALAMPNSFLKDSTLALIALKGTSE